MGIRVRVSILIAVQVLLFLHGSLVLLSQNESGGNLCLNKLS